MHLAAPDLIPMPTRAYLLHSLACLGETEPAEQVLAGLGQRDRDRGEMRIAAAVLRLAQDDPRAATASLAPVLDGSAPLAGRSWLVEAFMLEAMARDALGDPAAAGQAAERALDLAEPDRQLAAFLLYPAPDLLQRHARQNTPHAVLITQILGLLAGDRPAPPPRGPEPLLDSEVRVLRYLPTNLTVPEIASELHLSRNPSRPTCATCTPSSARTAGLKPSRAPVLWACSHPPRAGHRVLDPVAWRIRRIRQGRFGRYSTRSKRSRRRVPTSRSQIAFMWGAWTAVRGILVSAVWKRRRRMR